MGYGFCAVCGRRFRRASTGRPRITCGDACRKAMQGGRRLEAGPLKEIGYGPEQPSPLAMLAEKGIRTDPIADRLIASMYLRSRGR